MPLSIEIKVNGKPIQTLHVARMVAISRTAGIYRYSALLDPSAEIEREEQWDGGAMFEHRTSDGALVCAQKALAALDLPAGGT